MRHIYLLLLALPAAAGTKPEAAKIFTDKGSQYVRSDNKRALTVGAELVATDDSQKAVGKAVIMEVNGSLARITLDDEASTAKAKYALIPAPKVAAAPSGGSAPAAAAATPVAQLKASLEPGMRIRFANLSDQDWNDCELRTNDGKSLEIGAVPKHTDDTAMKFKFKSPPEPVYDHLTVTCAEGESQFFFGRPHAPAGTLKGYATNDKGSVEVFNQSANSWSSCDVKKPNGTHYVLGDLKASGHDSIDKGRFVKEAEQKGPEWMELKCREGAFRVKAD